jgi:hypothetical protein
MLVGRCSWELSGRKLHRKIKKSRTPSEASGSAVRHSCAPLLPAHNLHQSSLHGNTNLPLVIPARISCHAALDTVAYAPFS